MSDTEQNARTVLLDGPIAPTLIRMAVPMAFGGSMLFGLWGLLIGFSVASGLSALMAVLVVNRVLRDLERDVDRDGREPPSTSKLEYLPG